MEHPLSQKLLTRRQTIGLAGLAGAAYFLGAGRDGGRRAELGGLDDVDEAAAQAPSCVLSPMLTEGPYFVDERLNRSDIRGDRRGVPLTLKLNVVRVTSDGCVNVPGAIVDVWHCDASGLYSDVQANGTVGQTWLRGLQVTDPSGLAQFITVYPGWYAGRTPHIHIKVRVPRGSTAVYTFNTQLFFDEAVTRLVYLQAPYSGRGAQDTTNANDGIFRQSGGSTLVTPTSDGSGGYVGALTIGLSGLTDAAADTVADSSLTGIRWARTANGRRVLRLRLDVNESVSADARILRGARSVARKRTKSRLAPGTRLLKVAVPNRVVGGRARLKLTVTDAAGNVKAIRRKLRIPRRSRR